MNHTTNSITSTFNLIDSGKITNASFSDANVVMISKELYCEFLSSAELVKVCRDFIADQSIRCAESIYQADHVIENAYTFIEDVCDIMGYKES